MSARLSTDLPRACSGDMYAAVPRMMPACVACIDSVGDRVALRFDVDVGSSAFARPKSRTFTVPSSRTLMLAGFRSRWMIPASCAASSASAICLAIGSASASGIGPWAMRSASVGPSTRAVNVGDIRMVERRQHLRLAAETGETVGIVRDGREQNLDRDLAVQFRIARAIDLAHAAGAQRRDDFVRPEARAGIERQFPKPLGL